MMRSAHVKTDGTDLVPITDRMRYMQAFRLGAVLAVAAVAGFGPTLAARPRDLALASGLYLLLSVGSHLAWHVSRHGGVALFSVMAIIDGVYLNSTAYVTGDAASPIRYLIVLHVMTIALLGSYRTGIKVALWDSLLLLVVHYAREAGVLPWVPAGGPLDAAGPFAQLVAFSALLWTVAIATSSLSAVNERELRRRRYDLEALATMATRLEEAPDAASVADTVVDSVKETFDLERVAIVIGGPADARKTRLVTHLAPEADAWLEGAMPGARNLVIVPLTAAGNSIGALVAEHSFRRGSRIERRVVTMLERFAAHAALAFRNALLLDEVRASAETDALTGVANRRAFDAALTRELARTGRADEEATLLLIDIDHFKRINDTHGHPVGDAVLRRVAGLLSRACREYDVLARYGGEEFALLLPRTSADEGFAIAERLRSAAAGEGDPPITISVGAATFPRDGADAGELVAAADLALYASKQGGRDRVSVFAPADC